MDEWEYWMEHYHFITPNWSVYEYEESEDWDDFYMVKVGTGTTGVVMKGKFCSMPYEGRDWSGKNRKIFYRDLYISYIFHPEKDQIIPTSVLEKAIPDFDWLNGHSGICLNEGDVPKMEKVWNSYAKKNAGLLKERSKYDDYVIEPSGLQRVKNYEIWREKVCPHLSDSLIYTEAATHDCLNLKFSNDYSSKKFKLDVLFCDVVLKIQCSHLVRLKMDMDNGSTFMSDFSIAEAGPKYLHLVSNGIELWCEKIEFLGVTEYTKDSFPPCL